MNEPFDARKINYFRPHPWHGLEAGPNPPEVLNAFIEITPFDLMKYEVDKVSGYLRVDRPQRSSSQHPALYGFVPRTYCGPRVAKLARREAGRRRSARHLRAQRACHRAQRNHRALPRHRRPADDRRRRGGRQDHQRPRQRQRVGRRARTLSDVPPVLVDRLEHYFETYKLMPGEKKRGAHFQGLWTCARAQGRARGDARLQREVSFDIDILIP